MAWWDVECPVVGGFLVWDKRLKVFKRKALTSIIYINILKLMSMQHGIPVLLIGIDSRATLSLLFT